MRRQLASIYARFRAGHLKADANPVALKSAAGDIIGGLDIIVIEEGTLRVAGWVDARTASLFVDGFEVPIQPKLRRDDAAATHGSPPDVGFDVVQPLGFLPRGALKRLGFCAYGVARSQEIVRHNLNMRRPNVAESRLMMRFAGRAVRMAPQGLTYLVTGSQGSKAALKRGFSLESTPPATAISDAVFDRSQLKTVPDQPITIVCPVYNSFELLEEMLARVVANTDLPWHLILIEDGSTDDRVRPFLRNWAAARAQENDVTLIENPENIGFIKSVNKGFEAALGRGDAVVLLNSDAFVPKNWARRLMAPIFAHDNIATVTPMSNDAEIFTVPQICERNDLRAGLADAIDLVAQRLNPEIGAHTPPTGVGFCMGMSLAYLKRVPQFDTIFGRGYGEEVDWCQRVAKLGGRHVAATDVFVEHRGGQSFGSEEKLRLITLNNAKIAERYKDYDGAVQRFIADDPLLSQRLALALAWAGSGTAQDVSVYLAHALGGGADHWLEAQVTDALEAGANAAVILRVGGRFRWQIEVVTRTGRTSGGVETLEMALDLLKCLGKYRTVYSCGVGYPDPADLPLCLDKISQNGAGEFEILFHDFYPISPSYTLLDEDHVFRGTPIGSDYSDAAHEVQDAGSHKITLKTWQDRWGAIIAKADKITVFSKDSEQHVAQAYPVIKDRICVEPHKLTKRVPIAPKPAATAPRVVAVLGNIGAPKGAALLAPLANALATLGARLVVIGIVDPAYPLPANAVQHGPYDVTQLDRIVAQYGITDWFIPSIWPETFSYTTHEAIATGLPVHAFDLGAQGAAVHKAWAGNLIALGADNTPDMAAIEYFSRRFGGPSSSEV